MVVTPNYLCFDCIISKKMEKNYEDINTIVHSQFFVAFIQRAVCSLL